MAPDDSCEKERRIILRFPNDEVRRVFERTMLDMVRTSERNKQEGYRCGMCAAYPCFRTLSSQLLEDPNTPESLRGKLEKIAQQEAQEPAGLCFQATRRCRQECNNYEQDDKSGSVWPEGVCRIDNQKVEYKQDCHIPEMRSAKRLS